MPTSNPTKADPIRLRRVRLQLLALFRTRLGARLTVVFILVTLIPMVLVALLSYQRARASLIDLALAKVEQEAALTAKDMDTYLGQFFTDILALSKVPPVQGIIRARDNGGIDPATGESEASWVDWLRQLFASIAQGKQFYRSLSYLDTTGTEIVRIDYREGQVTIASADRRAQTYSSSLQNRADAGYFTAAKGLRAGEVYISPVTLNREGGALEVPHVPIIYFSTPIYDRAEIFRGVVVSSVYAASFLDRLGVDRGHVYLADEAGFYLAHPNPAQTFGFEVGADYNVGAEFPSAYAALIGVSDDSYTMLDTARLEVVALKKVHFDPRRPERYWLLVRTLPEDAVLGPVRTLGTLVLGVALGVIVMVALLALRLARGFTRPITRLTGVAEQISQTDLPGLVGSLGRVASGDVSARFELSAQPVAVHSEDEVGQLGQAFNAMIASLHEAHIGLAQTQEQLRMQKEAAEAANAAKSIFLANMSHELRTPLNGILGFAHILQQRVGPESPLLDGLATIEQSGEHLLTLITDILDLSRIEAGRLELAPTDLHLPTFLGAIANLIRMRTDAKDLRFVYQPDPALPPVILADETRLRQILLNLLGNALKFTDRGQVTLSVRTEGRELRTESSNDLLSPQSSVRVRFAVEDTGPGIPPEELVRIFQPFEQGGDATQREGGTGLGLTISRQLVRAMGGDIQVQSVVGQGSSFWFTISVPVLDTLLAAPAARVVTGYAGPRRSVLVVDDIAANRALLVELLTELGFTIYQAANGQEGIDQAQAHQPDLILMDCAMPLLDGRAATRRLRQLAAFQHTPIIAVSASVAGQDQAASLAAGASAFVAKPIAQAELLEQIGRLLRLEWLYAPARLAPSDAAPRQVGLPPNQARQLYELARQGLILELRERLEALERHEPRYQASVAELRQLARRYRLREIRSILEAYMQELNSGDCTSSPQPHPGC